MSGALEAEDLGIVDFKSSKGEAGRPERQHLMPNQSGDHMLQFDPGSAGEVSQSVPCEAEGIYDLGVYYLRAPDYGIVRPAVNGRPVGDPVDLYRAFIEMFPRSIWPPREYVYRGIGLQAGTNIIDKTNLVKAGRIPVIAAAIGGALWLLGFLGGLMGVLFWVVAAFAGYWYVGLALKAEPKPSLPEVAVNGAILGAVVGLVYAAVTWIAIGIRFSGLIGLAYRWGVGSLVRTLFEGAIGGAIGAAGWYLYKTGMIKTK